MKIKAGVISQLVFEMTPVPTPSGTITGASIDGDGMIRFKYADGMETEPYRPSDDVEVILL